MPIRHDQEVDGVMRQWPSTIRVFLEHGMHCVGCPIACFHSVEDACREHGVELEGFLSELRNAARSGPDGTAFVARWPDRGIP